MSAAADDLAHAPISQRIADAILPAFLLVAFVSFIAVVAVCGGELAGWAVPIISKSVSLVAR